MFENSHWKELAGQGYTVIPGAIAQPQLQAAQAAARHLNEIHPEGGWERTRNESWREVRYCRHPDLMAIASAVLDPLALEILKGDIEDGATVRVEAGTGGLVLRPTGEHAAAA